MVEAFPVQCSGSVLPNQRVAPVSIWLQGWARPEDERFYVTLGLISSASAAEIRRAYRQLAGKWHPDKWVSYGKQHQDIAARKFAEVAEAYAAINAARQF